MSDASSTGKASPCAVATRGQVATPVVVWSYAPRCVRRGGTSRTGPAVRLRGAAAHRELEPARGTGPIRVAAAPARQRPAGAGTADPGRARRAVHDPPARRRGDLGSSRAGHAVA